MSLSSDFGRGHGSQGDLSCLHWLTVRAISRSSKTRRSSTCLTECTQQVHFVKLFLTKCAGSLQKLHSETCAAQRIVKSAKCDINKRTLKGAMMYCEAVMLPLPLVSFRRGSQPCAYDGVDNGRLALPWHRKDQFASPSQLIVTSVRSSHN